MFAVLLHGGWDTLIAAGLFWLSPFIVAFLVIRWAVATRRTRSTRLTFLKKATRFRCGLSCVSEERMDRSEGVSNGSIDNSPISLLVWSATGGTNDSALSAREQAVDTTRKLSRSECLSRLRRLSSPAG